MKIYKIITQCTSLIFFKKFISSKSLSVLHLLCYATLFPLIALDRDVARNPGTNNVSICWPRSTHCTGPVLPLADALWTLSSAHTLDGTIATYHISKTPGAVTIS